MNERIRDAAPDLLAALKELVERREQVALRRGGSRELMDGSDGRYARARSAIAKAEGEATYPEHKEVG